MSNIKKEKFFDRLASVIIRGGGISVILCVILIILLIFKVAFPLFYPADVKKNFESTITSNEKVLHVGLGEYNEYCYYFKENGALLIKPLDSPKEIKEVVLRPNAKIKQVIHFSKYSYAVYYEDGLLDVFKVFSSTKFIEDTREVFVTTKKTHSLKGFKDVSLISVGFEKEEGRLSVGFVVKNQIMIKHLISKEDDFGDIETDESEEVINLNEDETVNEFVIGSYGKQFWIVSNDVFMSRYLFNGKEFVLKEQAALDSKVSCLQYVFGDVSIAVGFADGSLKTYFPVRVDLNRNERELEEIHSIMPATGKAIKKIKVSFRDKSLMVANADNELSIVHVTTHKVIKTFALKNLNDFAFNARNTGLITLEGNGISCYEVDDPHREVSANILFNKIWYEDYMEPEYVYQSSAESEDAEPKLSMIPLIFGSLKGTFYAMILSIPLALFSAIYISQFASPAIRSVVKPMVELMAAIPSVVIGFLAALWLAPKLDINLLSFFISFLLFPFCLLMFLIMWDKFFSLKSKKNADQGLHLFYLLPVFIFAILLSYFLGGFFEQTLFEGNFRNFLFEGLNLENYEQRNCIVIGFGLGFTVIPIIFTIAEDVLSTVPRSLTANSLALGANKWQTVWRVVLPSASPGIIAGVIIGFGRAIGETMIVLMATGNTPIIDASIFTGMRSLSANIAVEIPEAPYNGSLYRVLFLSAVILFMMTFILNTLAELIRQALRKKYSRFQ